jgi:hypothetical protein
MKTAWRIPSAPSHPQPGDPAWVWTYFPAVVEPSPRTAGSPARSQRVDNNATNSTEPKGVIFAFRWIPPGRFRMGAMGYMDREEPVHEVMTSARAFALAGSPVRSDRPPARKARPSEERRSATSEAGGVGGCA